MQVTNSISIEKHFDVQIKAIKEFHEEREKRYQERFKAQEEALRIADKRIEEYKVASNEWRGQSKDIIDTRVSMSTFEEYKKSTDQKLALMTKFIYIGMGLLIALQFYFNYVR